MIYVVLQKTLKESLHVGYVRKTWTFCRKTCRRPYSYENNRSVLLSVLLGKRLFSVLFKSYTFLINYVLCLHRDSQEHALLRCWILFAALKPYRSNCPRSYKQWTWFLLFRVIWSSIFSDVIDDQNNNHT